MGHRFLRLNKQERPVPNWDKGHALRQRQSRSFFQASAIFQNAGKKCEKLAVAATGPRLQARQRTVCRRGTCGGGELLDREVVDARA